MQRAAGLDAGTAANTGAGQRFRSSANGLVDRVRKTRQNQTNTPTPALSCCRALALFGAGGVLSCSCLIAVRNKAAPRAGAHVGSALPRPGYPEVPPRGELAAARNFCPSKAPFVCPCLPSLRRYRCRKS